jgi:hypothetical protein
MKSGEKAVKGKGKHPNCVAARKKHEFKKGEPVPKGGRPKGSLSLKERMDKFMHLEIKVKMPDGSVTKQEIADSIAMSLITQAQKGNIAAIKELLDRYYGKEILPINMMTQEKEEVIISIEERIRKYAKHD